MAKEQVFEAEDLIRFAGCRHAAWLALRAGDGAVAPAPDPDPACGGAGLLVRGGRFAARVSGWTAEGEAVLRTAQAPSVRDFLTAALASELAPGAGSRVALHIDGPDGRFSLPLVALRAYLRGLMARFERFVDGLPGGAGAEPASAPRPVAACAHCDFAGHCATELQARDSLYLVPGLRGAEWRALQAAGITSVAALAAVSVAEAEAAGLNRVGAERLQRQARLLRAARDGRAHFEPLAAVPGRGLSLLPEPVAGDLFYRRDDAGGGHQLAVAGGEARHFAGLQACLEALAAGLAAAPLARIYHASGSDLAALREQCTREGLGEAWLDQRLREGRFVDLQAITRGAVQSSAADLRAESLQPFWQSAAGEAEAAAAGPGLDAALRDWLVGLRPADLPWAPPLAPPSATAGEAEPAGPAEECDPDEQALRAELAAADLPQEMRDLLYNLGRFHSREAKPAQWAVFDSASRGEEALILDPDTLGGLRALGAPFKVARSMARLYRYPAQQTRLRSGKTVTIPGDEGGAPVSVTVTDLDPRRREVTLKTGAAKAHLLRDRLDLHPDWPLRTDVIAAALRDVITDYCGPRRYRAVADLLERRAPRLTGAPLSRVLGGSPDVVSGAVAAISALDHSLLPVQGPPGTGKTYVTARAILALLRSGQRVGVASNSHEAVRNVLTGCLTALEEADLPGVPELVHKVSGPDDGYPETSPVRRTTDNAVAAGTGDVVGGTAFFFARDENVQGFDWLFVDEAGQVGLATLAAMGRAARNIVLVGDPRQLPQVIQGAHPAPAGLSCLEFLLGDQVTVTPERGIFLGVSRRMRSDLCSFVSEQVYDGRLLAHPDTRLQEVQGSVWPGSGVFWVDVPHEGNQQQAPEEVAAIAAAVQELLAGRWQGKDGRPRPMRASDIIVVAPYNAQVTALAEALPPGVRVGTVDRFQGQEAPVCLVSMTASEAGDSARGMAFLLSLNRINVAVSRAKALALVFGSPRLREADCASLEEIRLVNTLCALPERA